MNEILIYENDQQQIEVRLEGDTVWLTQRQMADLFDKDVRTINEHIQNIYKTGELSQESIIRKFRIVRQEGSRTVTREVAHYNLDMVILVGYRDNSLQGTRFRIWATQRLKDYLLKGYAINQQRLAQNARELEQAWSWCARQLDVDLGTG